MKSLAQSIAISVTLCLFVSNRLVSLSRITFDDDDKKSLDSSAVYLSGEQTYPKEQSYIALVDKTCHLTRSYAIGDVIQFTSPREPQRVLIRRIVAKEGTSIYDPRMKTYYRIPKGHCWVGTLPFQRHPNQDTLEFDPISLGLIHGKIKAILWPLNAFQWIRSS